MFDVKSLIDYGGMLLVFLAVYAQTGLFFCFFLPSGGFIFTAGVLIAAGNFNYSFLTVSILLIAAAILGNITGYLLGRKAGPLLHKRKDSGFFRQKHLQIAENFYHKHGGPALTIGLFLPIIRTFAPVVAGMIKLRFRKFLLYITLGSIGWILSFLLAGYAIGALPLLKPYLNYIVLAIIILVTVPVIIKIVREVKKK